MNEGQFGPEADRIAREQLKLPDGFRIYSSSRVLRDFEEWRMDEALTDENGEYIDCLNPEDAIGYAEEACTDVWLPENMWFFKLQDATGNEASGLVQFTAEQAAKVSERVNKRAEEAEQ